MRMIGTAGPKPVLVEPDRPLNSVLSGEAPLLVLVEAAEERDRGGAGAAGRVRLGAVACASDAAAAPSGPWAASACCVEPDREPPALVLPPLPPPELCEPPATGCTVFVGRPPPAVGTVSTYWPTPEFPGGAIV